MTSYEQFSRDMGRGIRVLLGICAVLTALILYGWVGLAAVGVGVFLVYGLKRSIEDGRS